MTNIFKCTTCNEILPSEETETHQCKIRISKYRTIEAISYYTGKNDQDRFCIVINALNGIGYTFVIKEPILMPLSEGLSCDLIEPKIDRSDGFTHRELSDGDSPEPLKDGFKYYASFLLVR